MALSKLAQVYRANVREKVGRVNRLLVPDRAPTFADVRREYPTSSSLATALGLGRPGQYPRKTHPEKWRKRKNLTDDYARWARGQQDPFKGSHAKRLRSVVRSSWRREATPLSAVAVLRLMLRHGATVPHFEGYFSYQRGRHRTIHTVTYIHPSVLVDTEFGSSIGPPIDWGDSARSFLGAWAHAYGLDENVAAETEEEQRFWERSGGAVVTTFDFEIGRGGHVQQDYT